MNRQNKTEVNWEEAATKRSSTRGKQKKNEENQTKDC